MCNEHKEKEEHTKSKVSRWREIKNRAGKKWNREFKKKKKISTKLRSVFLKE